MYIVHLCTYLNEMFSFLHDTMAYTPIALSRTIISLWIGIQVYGPQVTSLSSLRNNYIMAYENKTWADHQIKKAQNKCREYTQYACQYKTPDVEYFHMDRILNGEYAPEGMLPHMAFLLIPSGQCSGTLISEKFVLTAAHCTFGVVCIERQVKIKLGSLDITNDRTGQWYGADHIYEHPYYKVLGSVSHDIALVELSETVRFNRNVRPICLNPNHEISKYNSAIAAGWGLTEHGKTNLLKMVELRLKKLYCDEFIKDDIEFEYLDAAKSYSICITDYPKNVCPGDSGGSLQVLMNDTCPNMYEQIAVTTHADDSICSFNSSDMYGIFAIVARYVPWIASIVWPEEDGQ